MMRRIAVVGDKIETGGDILPYSGPVCTMGNAGHQVALIGGTAWCATCQSTGAIAKAGGPRRVQFMGETAADRDIVICKCPTPPQIIATLSGESWCDDMAETTGVVTPELNGDKRNIPGTSQFRSQCAIKYDDRFVLRDANGRALAHATYGILRENGMFEYGETDSDGHTHLLAAIASAEKIDVHLAG